MKFIIKVKSVLVIILFVSNLNLAQFLHVSPESLLPKIIDKDYYHLDVNKKMIYDSSFGETTCTTSKDGDNFQQEFKSEGFEMYQRLGFVNSSYAVIDLKQEIDVFLFITHSVDVKYSEPAQMIGLPLVQGEIWKWTGVEYIGDNIDTLFISTEYSEDEKIRTPAGEFDCKRVDYVIRKSSGKVTRYYEWRTPGIGLVKLEADLDPKGFAGMIQGLLGYDEIYFTLKSVENI